ncbi:hypothetical protein CEXT_593791 [Caerostris extrusa]|uniref:Uncharacterized protein n=1 Tax=Caerostris extrusa TaxID=172846 RepID=A0AAV4Q6Y5_CAEEX|nr:hypothetical protein CEXT_593791 [Caerostris extrusa]
MRRKWIVILSTFHANYIFPFHLASRTMGFRKMVILFFKKNLKLPGVDIRFPISLENGNEILKDSSKKGESFFVCHVLECGISKKIFHRLKRKRSSENRFHTGRVAT